ncbi:hypothetical protein EVAR_47573_1 [Eumeta japonica]|uniref:Uncharacterized protein n=1 Tax=Eumeta variegata TaxID=151549 RepID=A0A4C1WNG8_EUMVA|nr:hypothetical protein EVAR_47573_1 [Eumeta japonica]
MELERSGRKENSSRTSRRRLQATLGHPVELSRSLEARERLSKRFRCRDRLTREQLLFTRNPSPRQSSRASLEYLLPPRSAPTEAPGGLTPRPFCALRRARPTRYGLMTARFKRAVARAGNADSDFHGHRPAVLSDQRLSWCPMSVFLGALTLRSVHPTAPVLLTKIGPLGTVIRSRGFIVRFRRSICTSESLRSSIRVSPDFDLTRHSSPSFGSQHLCSERALIRGLGTGRLGSARRGPRSASILPERSKKKLKRLFTFVTPFSLIVTHEETQRLAHMLDSLVRVSRRVLRVPETESSQTDTRTVRDYTAAVSMQARSVEAGRPPSRSDDRVKVAGLERRSDRPRTGRDALLREVHAVPGDDTHDPRPPTRPRRPRSTDVRDDRTHAARKRTLNLSVRSFEFRRAALSSNPTLRRVPLAAALRLYGPGTLYGKAAPFKTNLDRRPDDEKAEPPEHHMSRDRYDRAIRRWALSCSLAATKEILTRYPSARRRARFGRRVRLRRIYRYEKISRSCAAHIAPVVSSIRRFDYDTELPYVESDLCRDANTKTTRATFVCARRRNRDSYE